MRADRLLSELLLLQVHRRMTAGALAKQLEVSERTVHRDMEALSASGVPVYAERGVGGGWVLAEGYRTNLTGLNEAEIQSVFLSQPSKLLGDLGLRQASEAALIKLLAAIPSMSRNDAEYVRQRIHVDGAGWHDSDEKVPFLKTLQEATWSQRKLRLKYQREDQEIERDVDPLGLVAKGNVWYLVAAIEGNVRSYRVSRIQEAVLLDEESVRPRNFDLGRYWEDASADFRVNLLWYPVHLRVAPGMLLRMRHSARYARVGEPQPDPDGWMRLSVQFENEREAAEYVLGFGDQVEVLEPDVLRRRVTELARKTVSFYRRQ